MKIGICQYCNAPFSIGYTKESYCSLCNKGYDAVSFRSKEHLKLSSYAQLVFPKEDCEHFSKLIAASGFDTYIVYSPLFNRGDEHNLHKLLQQIQDVNLYQWVYAKRIKDIEVNLFLDATNNKKGMYLVSEVIDSADKNALLQKTCLVRIGMIDRKTGFSKFVVAMDAMLDVKSKYMKSAVQVVKTL